MKKDKSTEKQFLEYLDRLLAGEDITLGADVPDEVRSALEHARKLLAFREEPSPAFRAELRNKLLRQVAEKQAPAYPVEKRPGWGERMANIFPPRPVLIGVVSTAVVVFLAFIGVVWFSGRGGAPMATVAPPAAPSAAEYSVRLPANIVPEGVTFEAATPLTTNPGRAAVYEVKSRQVTVASVTELGKKLGFTGQAGLSRDGTKIVMTQGSGDEARQLTVWTATGAVDYGYVEPEKLYPSTPPSLPSQSQAELIAYNFLRQADLLPPDYHSLAQLADKTTVASGGGYSVGKTYTEQAAPPASSAPLPAAAPAAPSAPAEEAAPSPPPAPMISTYWVVAVPLFVDGMEATGPGSMIDLSIGADGQVLRMLSSWRPVSPLRVDSIISVEQAFHALVVGEGSLEVPLDCKKVVVDRIQLKYWLDPPSEKQDYVLPVYEFTGTCLDKNGKPLESFTGWTPALATN